MDSIKIGMIGFGTVGAGVVNLLEESGSALADRIGRKLVLEKIAARDLSKKRGAPFDRAKLTTDPKKIVESRGIDIVIEVMGGEDEALGLTLQAIKNGKHVVTANKLMLALRGEEVYKAAEEAGVELGFEAAVAGAIPVIRTIRHSFASDRILLVQGIVNGTGNYILSRMTDEGKPFDEILKDAQALGYAEADPALDVGGGDSAHKIAILASLAFKTPVDFKDVYTEGITAITPEDIIMAGEFGYRVKLLALARRSRDSIDVRVHPAMLPKSHMIANVNGALNAVEIIGDYAGPNTLQGPGAGAGPTASAVVADIVDIGEKIVHGGAGKVSPVGIPLSLRKKIPVAPVEQVSSEYYLRFTVTDRPGVLAEISGALGRNKISISSMIQRGRKENEPVSVVLMTHTALESDLNRALGEIAKTDVCQADTMRVRIVKDA
ncbi:Homoserine dehydrogenase [hydrothermal vent metagenome]|uniref:Homoserine dehydrogenase n=1 Tax=hydrothermal vent metagenome TaxID=652676 RepID=A0A3B1CMA9_9ZZZZ